MIKIPTASMKKLSAILLFSSFFVLAACSSDSDDGGYTGFGGGSGNDAEDTDGSTDTGGSGGSNQDSSIGVTAFIVSGKVLDMSDNPVANATVTIEGLTATTDAQGEYAIDDVPLNNLAPLDISIASANHLSASYTITPDEQNTFTDEKGTDCSSFNNQGEPLQDLLDASNKKYATVCAKSVKTLATTATLSATVKDFSGNNQNIANANVSLEWLGATSLANQPNVTLITAPVSSTTNNAGVLSLTNLPVDSYFKLTFENYALQEVQPVQTLPSAVSDANITASATSIYVEPANQDTQSPKLTRVNGVLSVDAGTGFAKLNQNIDGTTSPLIIQFDEIVDATQFTASDVVLSNNGSGVSINANLNETANALLVSTTAPLAAGEKYNLRLNRMSFQDKAGNLLEVEGLPFASKSLDNSEVVVKLQTYQASISSPSTVVISQVIEKAETDYPLIYQLNETIKDVSSTLGIQQLNSTDNDDNYLGHDTAERMLALVKATVESATDDQAQRDAFTPEAISVDQARISFAYTKGSDLPRYAVSLKDSLGTAKVVNIVEEDLPQGLTVINNASNQAQVVVSDAFAGTAVELVLDSVEIGNEVAVTPMNNSGTLLLANQGSLSLNDLIPPTTVVQRSYGQGLKSTHYLVPNLGSGGEIIDTTSPVGPYLNITPWLLAQTQAGGLQVTNADTVWESLVVEVARDPTTNNAEVDVTFPAAFGYVGYDATAIAQWLPNLGSRFVGIAFSENITLAGIPSLTGVTANLSGWAEYNNVYQSVLGNLVNEDLVSVEVDNVFTLANDDQGGVIDFSGVIADSQSNTSSAAENPSVIVRDLMPPMAEKAQLIANDTAQCNGSSYCLIIDFNEPVTLQPDDEIQLFSSAKDGAIENTSVIKVDKNASNNINTRKVIIDLTDYKEPTPGLLEVHDHRMGYREILDRGELRDGNGFMLNPSTMVSFADVRDVNGVSWNNWFEGEDSPMKKPAIAMTVINSDVPGFSVTTAPTTGVIGDVVTDNSAPPAVIGGTRVVLVYEANHPFYLETVGVGFPVESVFTIKRPEVDTDPVPSILPVSQAMLSDFGRRLTITIETDRLLKNTDELIGISWSSAWNSSITLTMPDVELTY